MQALIEILNQTKSILSKSLDDAISIGFEMDLLLNEKEERLKEKEKELEKTKTQLEVEQIQFTNARAVFEVEKKVIKQQCENMDDIVSLNVGGKIEQIAKSKLVSIEGSMLSAMFSGRHAPIKDKDGNYFLDRDPKVFRYVLRYLRNSKIDKFLKPQTAQLICDEFDYFCIPFNRPRYFIDCQRKDLYSPYLFGNWFFKMNSGVITVQNLDIGCVHNVCINFAFAWKDYIAHNDKLYFLYESGNFYNVEIVSILNGQSKSTVVPTDISIIEYKPVTLSNIKTNWFIFGNEVKASYWTLMLHLPSFNKVNNLHFGIKGCKFIKTSLDGEIFIVDYKVLKYNKISNSFDHQQKLDFICQILEPQSEYFRLEYPMILTKLTTSPPNTVLISTIVEPEGKPISIPLIAPFPFANIIVSTFRYFGVQSGHTVYVYYKASRRCVGMFYNSHITFGIFGDYLCLFANGSENGHLIYMPDYLVQ